MTVKEIKKLIKNMDDDATVTFWKTCNGELKVIDIAKNIRQKGVVIRLAAE